MSKKIVLSTTAKNKLSDLLEYLESKWSIKVKQEFIVKLDSSLSKIACFPKSCPESKKERGLFRCVVTRQTTIYYRIEPKEIQIITLFDTRQDPKKLTTKIR